jgi:hypothetical protein
MVIDVNCKILLEAFDGSAGRDIFTNPFISMVPQPQKFHTGVDVQERSRGWTKSPIYLLHSSSTTHKTLYSVFLASLDRLARYLH